jgi:drug/metabolite transporter (DMT)-like permease
MAVTLDIKRLAAFFGVIVISAGIYIAVRLTDLVLPPLWGAGSRFAIGSLLFFAILLLKGIRPPRGKPLLGAVTYGILGFGVSNGLVYYALLGVPAGLTSVILSIVPLITVLLASAQRQASIEARGVVGATIALAGTL